MNGGNPYALHTILRSVHRRDTIAFMPQSIAALKFADEQEEVDDDDESEIEDVSQSSTSISIAKQLISNVDSQTIISF